jgi:hypothetical protein
MDTQDQGFYALDRSFDGSASLGLRAPRKSQGGTQEEEVVVSLQWRWRKRQPESH